MDTLSNEDVYLPEDNSKQKLSKVNLLNFQEDTQSDYNSENNDGRVAQNKSNMTDN